MNLCLNIIPIIAKIHTYFTKGGTISEQVGSTPSQESGGETKKP